MNARSDPGEHYRELTSEFGAPCYTRIDAPATPAQKARLAGLSPEAVQASTIAGDPIIAKLLAPRPAGERWQALPSGEPGTRPGRAGGKRCHWDQPGVASAPAPVRICDPLMNSSVRPTGSDCET